MFVLADPVPLDALVLVLRRIDRRPVLTAVEAVDAAGAPRELPTSELRRVTEALVDRAVQAVAASVARSAISGQSATSGRRRRAVIDDELLREVGEVASADTAFPVKAVKEHFGYLSERTAARWLAEARTAGYAPPPTPGRARAAAAKSPRTSTTRRPR